MTFPDADDVRAAAGLTPLDKLLVETDAPYLAPPPRRGRENEPGLVTLVGAVSLAAPRRNEILMTLIFPLAGLALSTAAAALSSGRKWSP